MPPRTEMAMPADQPPRVLLLDVMSTLVTDPFYESCPPSLV